MSLYAELVDAARRTRRRLRELGKFRRDFERFSELSRAGASRFTLSRDDWLPCTGDATGSTEFDRHYVYHPAWAARVLARTQPKLHVDIGSCLQFSAMMSAFLPVEFYDYRPAELRLPNLESKRGDVTALPFPDASVESLSCMHVVEHVGLGRYGDPLDPDGDLKAISELKRVVARGGDLLFVVPTGRPRIQFNAHRIYAYSQVVEAFAPYVLKEFALIPDRAQDGGLVAGASSELADAQTYGCGCYWFTRA